MFFTFQTKMPLITVKRHKYSMVDIKTVISSKHRLRLIDSIKSMVITIKTTDLKRHRLYPKETHENRRQSTILPMKSFVWVWAQVTMVLHFDISCANKNKLMLEIWHLQQYVGLQGEFNKKITVLSLIISETIQILRIIV